MPPHVHTIRHVDARARAALLQRLRCPRALRRYLHQGNPAPPEADQAIAHDALAIRGLTPWIPDDPLAGPVLIVAGTPPERAGVAVVGARASDPYGIAVAERAAHDVVDLGRSLISGGAEGCDAAAHKAALEAGGHTLVVLGSGHDRIYPAHHRKLFARVIASGGGVASPYWPDTPPAKYRFLQRNTVIIGLSAAVIVARAAAKSGALRTGTEALSIGRPVLAVPGSVGLGLSEGAHLLLAVGAKPMSGSDSLRAALSEAGGTRWPISHVSAQRPWRNAPKGPHSDGPLPAEVATLLAHLRSVGSTTVQALLETSNLGFSAMADALLELQIRGLITHSEQGEVHLCGD